MDFLISAGYPPDFVFKMTLRQYRAYLRLAWERTRDGMAAVASGSRMAYHAEDKAFQQYIETLLLG